MRKITLALGAAALFACPSIANAALLASLGGGTGPFVTLSSSGLNGGAVATLSGGTIYTADQPFADIPKGSLFGGTFLAAGPQAGQPARLNFVSPLTYLSFLWGSPDTYNTLTLTTNQQTYTYNVSNLGFAVTNGNQTFSQYVQFAASAGETISSVSFGNSPAFDAFEVANFSVTAVPEPATWALMLMGMTLVAGAVRYRRRNVSIVYA